MPEENKKNSSLPDLIELHSEKPADKPSAKNSGKSENNTAKTKPVKKPSASSVKPKSLEDMLKENLEWSEKIYEQNRKIKRRLGLIVIGGYLKLVLIIAPIIVAIIYLPSLLGGVSSEFGELFGSGDSKLDLLKIFGSGSGINIEQLIQNASPEQIEQMKSGLENMPVK